MKFPFISCVCPTYKRPEVLKNALACFLAQDYPEDRCELLVCDDAGQFEQHEGARWRLTSTTSRYPNLPAKFNAMIQQVKGDVIAIWEDDDIFLPWYLKDVGECFLKGKFEFYVSKKVFSTYAQKLGCVQTEDATNRFHSSWRFTRKMFEKVGGYPETEKLSFDQQFGALLKEVAGGVSYYGDENRPSYVYRWGNGYWHGSQNGEGRGFASLWEFVGNLPAFKQGPLKPKFDLETLKIYELLSK